MGIIVSKAWPAYRVCEGIETLSAEGNAATVARHGDGMGREGDGHGIWIQLCALSVAGGGDLLWVWCLRRQHACCNEFRSLGIRDSEISGEASSTPMRDSL